MSGLTHNVSAQANELLDHIYEYGTNSEGVISRINSLCDAAVEQLRTELAVRRAAGEAAGYARGLADERERCASVAWAHYMDTCRRKGIGPDVLPDWCCAAALRREVKP